MGAECSFTLFTITAIKYKTTRTRHVGCFGENSYDVRNSVAALEQKKGVGGGDRVKWANVISAVMELWIS
jgi:hypothetical protein